MSVKKQFSSNIVTVTLQIDDQISLLINAWCELLVLAACHRSSTCPPGTIRVSSHVSLGLEEARRHGIEKCVEKMLSFTEQLRRLKVDQFEYVSMKLICLLTSGRKERVVPSSKEGRREAVQLFLGRPHLIINS